MLWARSVMDDWIGEDGGKPHVKTLTAYFLALYFIMATQVCTEQEYRLQRPPPPLKPTSLKLLIYTAARRIIWRVQSVATVSTRWVHAYWCQR